MVGAGAAATFTPSAWGAGGAVCVGAAIECSGRGGARLLRGCLAGGGFGGGATRFAAAGRGAAVGRASARTTARAASSALSKHPSCTCLPSRVSLSAVACATASSAVSEAGLGVWTWPPAPVVAAWRASPQGTRRQAGRCARPLARRPGPPPRRWKNSRGTPARQRATPSHGSGSRPH
eukprot:scaffold53422_cov62-Phaeocystis_antarctica.AAC.4